MYSFEMVTVTDFTDEIIAKMQTVEPEKLMEYCYSINESATESAKHVREGMKTVFTKLYENFFEETLGHDGPLMIDLVVRNIMKCLPLKDLASCRQVCKLWNQEATSYFRRKQRIIFHPESIEKIETFTSFMQSQESLPDFKKLSPFTTYCFSAQYPTTQFPRRLMQEFVRICGQYVKKLEIFYPDDGTLSPEDFYSFFLAGMPNLESIHFVNLPQTLTQKSFLRSKPSAQIHRKRDTDVDKAAATPFPSEDTDSSSELDVADTTTNTTTTTVETFNFAYEKDEIEPIKFQLSAVTHLRIDRTWQIETSWQSPFLEDLLSLMPNLTDYELWTWNSTSEDEHSNPYLTSLSQQNRHSLKILRPGSIGDKLGSTIADLGLKLHKLFLPVLNRDVSAKTIEYLLQSQRHTLQEFQLNCSTMQDSRLITFPKMESLKSIHIIITYPWNNSYTSFTPGIRYEDQFPKLAQLKLELAIYNDFGFFDYFFPSGGTTLCPSVKELDLSFSGFRDDKFIGVLALIFPNIRRFRLDGYGNKIFSSVCLHMQNLEWLELYMIYGFNVDDQLTGISKDVCASIRKSQRFSDFKLDEVQHYPSLCSLSKLRTLVIRQKDYQSKFWPNSQCITNITAHFALAQMKQLRYLHIESVKFKEECRTFLAKALEDCWLDFT